MGEITDKYIDLVYKTPDPSVNPDEVKEFGNKIRQFHMLMY